MSPSPTVPGAPSAIAPTRCSSPTSTTPARPKGLSAAALCRRPRATKLAIRTLASSSRCSTRLPAPPALAISSATHSRSRPLLRSCVPASSPSSHFSHLSVPYVSSNSSNFGHLQISAHYVFSLLTCIENEYGIYCIRVQRQYCTISFYCTRMYRTLYEYPFANHLHSSFLIVSYVFLISKQKSFQYLVPFFHNTSISDYFIPLFLLYYLSY